MLTETVVIAPGSLNGFLIDKHLDRCTILHPLLALASTILHFKAFLQTCDCREELHNLKPMVKNNVYTGKHKLGLVIDAYLFYRCSKEYSEFTKATVSGAHGYTVKYRTMLLFMYVEHMQVFHQLGRTISKNN